MFFVIRKLDLKCFFDCTFGSIKPPSLYLVRMFYNIQNSNKIIVIKNMAGWKSSSVNTFNTISFYVKVIKVRPCLTLNELDKIAEKEIILPWKRTYHQMRQQTLREVIVDFFRKRVELCQEWFHLWFVRIFLWKASVKVNSIGPKFPSVNFVNMFFICWKKIRR